MAPWLSFTTIFHLQLLSTYISVYASPVILPRALPTTVTGYNGVTTTITAASQPVTFLASATSTIITYNCKTPGPCTFGVSTTTLASPTTTWTYSGAQAVYYVAPYSVYTNIQAAPAVTTYSFTAAYCQAGSCEYRTAMTWSSPYTTKQPVGGWVATTGYGGPTMTTLYRTAATSETLPSVSTMDYYTVISAVTSGFKAPAPSPTTPATTGDILVDWSGSVWIAPVSIGTQSFNLMVDTGSQSLYVIIQLTYFPP